MLVLTATGAARAGAGAAVVVHRKLAVVGVGVGWVALKAVLVAGAARDRRVRRRALKAGVGRRRGHVDGDGGDIAFHKFVVRRFESKAIGTRESKKGSVGKVRSDSAETAIGGRSNHRK